MAGEDAVQAFSERMKRAEHALRGGEASALAYTVDVDVQDVARVGGTTSDHSGSVRDRPGRSSAA